MITQVIYELTDVRVVTGIFIASTIILIVSLTQSYFHNQFLLGRGLNLFSRFPFFLNSYKVLRFISLSLYGLVFLLYFLPSPKVVSPNDPALGATSISDKNPIRIEFSRPINSSKIKKEIIPDLPGEWRHKGENFGQKYVLEFYPSESPIPDTRYTVSLTEISGWINPQKADYLFSILSYPVPVLRSSNLVDGDSGVLTDQEFNFELDYFDEKLSRPEFVLEPAVEIDITETETGFQIKPKTAFIKGTSYHLTFNLVSQKYDYIKKQVSGDFNKTELFSGNFSIIEAPGIKSFSPQSGGVKIDTPIIITFKQDMDTNSVQKAFSISPQSNGTYKWQGQREVSYSAPLAKNTNYQVKLSSSASTLSGESLSEELSFEFTTIGYVEVLKITPSNKSSNIAINSPIQIAFNQKVDQKSAEDSFSISPEASGSFTWSGNTMTFNHSGMKYSEEYRVTLNQGIKSIHGLDSNRNFCYSFITKSQSVTLDVTAFKQQHMYSCMIAATRSAMAYKGKSYSEAEIIDRVGYDTTSWSGTWNEPGSVWGNPDVGIVGDLDGKANNIGWGYGAYWNPMAKAINSFGLSAEVKTGSSASDLAAEISNGNPVIIWWVNGVWPAYEVFWNDSAGNRVRGVNSMHVQVVKGFTGTVENPTSFTVTDSGYGYPQKTFDTTTFNAKWSWFNKTAVIVK